MLAIKCRLLKAAKQFFDSLGLGKLSSVKAMKHEYAVLNAENKRLYTDPKSCRKGMTNLLTAKSNLERFL